MDVLTVKQPWASLIVEPDKMNPGFGIKPIENRTWKCPEKYIGKRVLIHAGILVDKNAVDKISLIDGELARKMWFEINDDKLPLGAIIGSVEIVDCVLDYTSIWSEKWITKHYHAFGTMMSYEKQPYNWVLANPIKFEKPIPAKGKLRFWEYPDELLKQNYIISCDSSTDKTDYTAETTFKITDGKLEIAEIKT